MLFKVLTHFIILISVANADLYEDGTLSFFERAVKQPLSTHHITTTVFKDFSSDKINHENKVKLTAIRPQHVAMTGVHFVQRNQCRFICSTVPRKIAPRMAVIEKRHLLSHLLSFRRVFSLTTRTHSTIPSSLSDNTTFFNLIFSLKFKTISVHWFDKHLIVEYTGVTGQRPRHFCGLKRGTQYQANSFFRAQK